MLGLEPRGYEFESRYSDCGDSLVGKCPTVTRESMGSIPIHHRHSIYILRAVNSTVECLVYTEEVIGSNPILPIYKS